MQEHDKKTAVTGLRVANFTHVAPLLHSRFAVGAITNYHSKCGSRAFCATCASPPTFPAVQSRMHDHGVHHVLRALLLTLACTTSSPHVASAFVALPSMPTTPTSPSPHRFDSLPREAGRGAGSRSTGRRRTPPVLSATSTSTSTSTPRPGPGAGADMQQDEQALPELNQDEVRRYSRHLILPDVGVEGQRRLKASSVLAVGTGGLGSPALLYLAAAGVGRLGIVDDDVVDESNLQRQVCGLVCRRGRHGALVLAAVCGGS